MESKPKRGFSTYLSFGRGKGWGFHQDGPARRLCLGFVTVCVAGVDLESLMGWVTKLSSDIDATREDLYKARIDLQAQEKALAKKQDELWIRGGDLDTEKELLGIRQIEMEKEHAIKMSQDFPGKTELEKSLAESLTTVADLESKFQKTEATIESMKGEVESLKVEVDGYETEVADLEEQNEALAAENENMKSACKNIAKTIEVMIHE